MTTTDETELKELEAKEPKLDSPGKSDSYAEFPRLIYSLARLEARLLGTPVIKRSEIVLADTRSTEKEKLFHVHQQLALWLDEWNAAVGLLREDTPAHPHPVLRTAGGNGDLSSFIQLFGTLNHAKAGMLLQDLVRRHGHSEHIFQFAEEPARTYIESFSALYHHRSRNSEIPHAQSPPPLAFAMCWSNVYDLFHAGVSLLGAKQGRDGQVSGEETICIGECVRLLIAAESNPDCVSAGLGDCLRYLQGSQSTHTEA